MSPLSRRFPSLATASISLAGLLIGSVITGCSRSQPPPAPPPPAKTEAPAAAAKAETPAAAKPATVAPTATAPAAGEPKAEAAKAPAPSPAAPSTPRRPTDAEREKARQSAAEMVPVETAPVTRGPISAFLTFNTTLETEAMVDIYPQTTGQVEALYVEEGRIVKEGEPLLKIEDRELRVDLEESEANFEQLQRNFTRTEDLFVRKLVNQQDQETQKNALELARLRFERAKIRLAYTTVRAPFAGVIASRETQIGARVSTGTKLFSMVKLDEVVAKVYVPGRYLTVVADRQPAVVTSEFLPDRKFTGWVKRISPVIDPKSGTFKVTVGVRGEKPADLPPGLFVNVRIITDTRPSAVLIPKRALIYEGGERYVFAVVNDRAVKRRLAAGYEDPDNIEAVSGFEPGATVIVLGQSGLKDGSLVRSVTKPASPDTSTAPTPTATPPAPTTPPAPVAPTTPAAPGKS